MKYLYQWGFGTTKIDNPQKETLQHFLDRKNGIITPLNEDGAREFLTFHSANVNTLLKWFIGTEEEFLKYKEEQPVRDKADKGQEVENAIELNELIKGFILKKLRTYEGFMFNHLRHNNESGYDSISIKRNGIISKLNQVERFETDIAIATNLDPTHPINFLEENGFVEILKEIKAGDAWRWTNITKMLKVEESYEPEAVKNEYIKLQQLVNSHIQGSNPIDPNIANGKDTLANELGGTQSND